MTQRRFIDTYGPWAVVTGASDGIGLAFSEELASIGLNLVLAARRADRLYALGSDLRSKYGTETVAVPADLSTPEGLASVEEATAHLDMGLLIAAAGYGTSGPLLGANLTQEHNLLEVNCFAVLQFVSAFQRRSRLCCLSNLNRLVLWQLNGLPSANFCASS